MKIGKTLPGLMSLYFYCNMQVIGSQFGVNNMKKQLHRAAAPAGIIMCRWYFLLHILGPLVPIEDH